MLIMIINLLACKKDNAATLNPIPVASFNDVVIGTLPVVVSFINTSTSPGPGSSFLWKFGDGGTSVTNNPIHSYNSFASYDVTLIQTSTMGVIDSITKNIIIEASGKLSTAQGADFVYSIGSAAPFTVNFTNTSQNGNSYLWDFGDGITSSSSNLTLSHIYVSGGTYTVKLKVTSNGGVDSTSRTLILH